MLGVIPTLTSCHYRYYLTVQEVQPIAIGSITFGGAEISLPVADSNTLRIMLSDTTKVYVRVGVYVYDTLTEPRQISLRVDSVVVELEGGFKRELTMLTNMDNKYVGDYIGVGLTIQPIGVPNDYKQDFKVSFRLRVYDKTSGELVFSDRVTAHVEYYDHKYFLTNSPYD